MKTNDICSSVEHLFVDALFGDIDAQTDETLKAHLASCAACANAFKEMQGTLLLTSQAPQEMPSEAYWAEFQERLDQRIAAGTTKRAPGMPLAERIRAMLLPPPAWAYQVGFAVVLVLVGVFIGRYGLPGSGQGPVDQIASNEAPAEGAYQLVTQTQRYLDRSSVLLMGLVNFDAEQDGTTILNLDHKRQVASTLIEDAAVLKASLDRSEAAQLRMLIEELEKILLQIANLEAQEDLPGIEMIQDGIEGRALLMKINLETMKLMDQPAPVDQSAPAFEL